MVRAIKHGQLSSSPPAYYDYLPDLLKWAESPPLENSHEADLIPLEARERWTSSKLIVCHDFKGGYAEKEFERDYTFSWWHLTDTFIYFSHHRVTIPPPAWIRAAHRHGTAILGTLIFEHEQGAQELVSMLDENEGKEYAIALILLAKLRGFEGWLINVEVDLPRDEELEAAGELPAKSLIDWLKFLTEECHKQIPGGQIVWYDAVTTEGKLQWQNSLTRLNAPFLEVCDSIFLDYHWRPHTVEQTRQNLAKLANKSANQIHFGIDVYGRGQYGGGSFESWRSFDLITKNSNSFASPPSNFSLALFAPGWTVESEHLNHSLQVPIGYTKWWQDESFLWNGTHPSENLGGELKRLESVRRKERGINRARELAISLGKNSGMRTITDFDYNAPLPSLPGTFKPISFYRKARPAPAPENSFFTNFSRGSGHAFYLNGLQIFSSPEGFTDIDYTFPFPSLAFAYPAAKHFQASFDEQQVWRGTNSLKLEISDANFVEIVQTCVKVEDANPVKVTIIWKGEPNTQIEIQVGQHRNPNLLVYDQQISDCERDWSKSSMLVTAEESTRIESIGISAVAASPSSPSIIYVGSISTVPVSLLDFPLPRLTNFIWSDSNEFVTWEATRRAVPAAIGATQLAGKPNHERKFQYYTLWYETSSGTLTFLGTTSATEFPVSRSAFKGGKMLCRGVSEDGTVENVAEGVALSV